MLLCAHVAVTVLSLASAVQRVQIYPCYINSKRTVAAGRKIAKAKGTHCSACHRVGCWPLPGSSILVCAACEDPTPLEIVDCCIRGLKLQADLEVRLLALVPAPVFAGLAAYRRWRLPFRLLTVLRFCSPPRATRGTSYLEGVRA